MSYYSLGKNRGGSAGGFYFLKEFYIIMDIKLIFKYYWPHIKKYKKSTLLAFGMYALAAVGTDIIAPLIYKRIIDIVSGAQDPQQVAGLLMSILLVLIASLVFTVTVFRIGDYALTFSQSNIIRDITNDAFQRLQEHSYEFFSNNFTGSLVTRVRRYVNAFEAIQDQIVFMFWHNGLKLIFGITVLTWYSPILGGIFFVWLAIYTLISFFFAKHKIKKDLLEAQANSRVTGILADVMTNILNVKMFASRKREIAYFSSATEDEEVVRRKSLYFQNLQFTFQSTFIILFEVVSMYTAISLWIDGSISAGTIVLMQIYLFASFGVVWNIGRSFTRFMRSFAQAKEMVDIFEEPLSVKDPMHPEDSRIDNGHIKIQNIFFGYGGGGAVFQNLSLDIKPGERIGLVGSSGAGKTTITKLLLRFADLSDGRILIDGQDISHLTQDVLRSQIAYVPQEPVLFHRTIRENIAYGSANAGEKEIIEASKSAHAYDFIMGLPQGFDTLVGERGIKLSGGERQRVAIARAMIKDAPVLILDEATSSLDSISESYIQDAFGNLMEGRTTIVVAHRLSTIQKMDRIIVFDKGAIAEEGTHSELISAKGIYYQLYKQQSEGFVLG